MVVLAVMLLAAGCGHPLTAPTPSPEPAPAPPAQTAPAPAPEPEPAPEPPPPVVTPPQPTPPPAPAPKPQPQMTLDATTFAAHWHHPASALPATFTIEVWADYVWLGELRLPRIALEGGSVLARSDTYTFTMTERAGRWQWTVNALAGQAHGEALAR